MKTYVDKGAVLEWNGYSIPKDPQNAMYADFLREQQVGQCLVVPYVPPPPTVADRLGPTDRGIIRGIEDIIGVLISKNLATKTDFPAALVDKINARRAIRGQGPL